MKVSDCVKLQKEIIIPITGPNFLILKPGTMGTIQANGYNREAFFVLFNLESFNITAQVNEKDLQIVF
jgi:hypothetical protein